MILIDVAGNSYYDAILGWLKYQDRFSDKTPCVIYKQIFLVNLKILMHLDQYEGF